MDIGINLINPASYKTKFRDKESGPTNLTTIMALSQKFAKLMLTTAGSDVYALALERTSPGTTLKELLQDLTTQTPLIGIRSRIDVMVQKTKTYILEQQQKHIMSKFDQLHEATLVDVYRDENARLVIKVVIVNMAGESFIALINQDQIENFSSNVI